MGSPEAWPRPGWGHEESMPVTPCPQVAAACGPFSSDLPSSRPLALHIVPLLLTQVSSCDWTLAEGPLGRAAGTELWVPWAHTPSPLG